MADEKREVVPPPIAVALVICDFVWRDPWLGKCTIIGTYTNVRAHEFPAMHPIMTLYAALTNGRGRVPLTVRVIDVDEERDPVVSLEQEIEFPDPKTVVENIVQMAGLIFPEPGEYRVQILAGQVCLIERSILVTQQE